MSAYQEGLWIAISGRGPGEGVCFIGPFDTYEQAKEYDPDCIPALVTEPEDE